MRRILAACAVAVAVVLMIGLGQSGADLLRDDRTTATRTDRPVDRTAAAGTTEFGLRTVSYNMCGGQCNHGETANLPQIVTKIDAFRPHLVMLQEVCWSQYEWFKNKYAGTYEFDFTPMLTTYTGCGVSDCSVNTDGDTANDDKRCHFGQVMAGRGALGAPDVIPLGGERHQINQKDVGGPITQVKPERTFSALCHDVSLADLPGRTVKGCSVHLRAFADDALVNLRARTAQAARLASDLDGDIAAGKIVVVAGDFNSTPENGNSRVPRRNPTMNAFYRPETQPGGGWGVFYEADQADQRMWGFPDARACVPTTPATGCRSGERTVTDDDFVEATAPGEDEVEGTKYDYIFYSELTSPTKISGDPFYLFLKDAAGHNVKNPDGTDKRISDHAFYQAVGQVSTS